MKNRDFSLDYIKAFAIILVVMDHIIRNLDSPDNPIITFIYSIHMPLFFLVSGILSYKKQTNIHELFAFFIKKTKLLIPIVVFGLGNVLILKQEIGEFLIWHKFGLWFLWTLFLFFCIYAVSQLYLIKNNNKVLEIIGLVIPVALCIALRTYQNTVLGGIFNALNLYNYTFFILGVCYKRYMENFINLEWVQLLLFIVYVVGLISQQTFLNIPMKACGVLFFLFVAKKLTQGITETNLNKKEKTMVMIGQNSLYIYVLHYYLIIGIANAPKILHDVIFFTPCIYIPFCFVLALIIIITCIGIAKVLNVNKLVGLMIFGR
ncbi:MAG: acyltransferase family protein [Bacteroidales bacterium]|nr:acyltransferase family protein [Bacteroidales bacterium]MBR4497557.1 acyltransferase family protein [Bacteroidales bacterium]